MRVVGHRGLGQLSMAEFVLILALGSAVGDPMFYADIPLIYGMLVITLIVVYQIILIKLTIRSEKFGAVMDGVAIRLVVDGMVDLAGERRARLSRFEMMAELRHSGLAEMGEIKRAYLELDGKVSVLPYPKNETKPGLSLLPEYIEAPVKWTAGDKLPASKVYACTNCGFTQAFEAGTKAPVCPRCQAEAWMAAAYPTSIGEQSASPE
jgi:uncharacterized membrane protein YcaP (DUF421 family)